MATIKAETVTKRPQQVSTSKTWRRWVDAVVSFDEKCGGYFLAMANAIWKSALFAAIIKVSIYSERDFGFAVLWPPNGFAAGTALIAPNKQLPFLIIGFFVSLYGMNMTVNSAFNSTCFTAINMLEMLIGYMIVKVLAMNTRVDNFRKTLVLVLASLAAPASAGLLGAKFVTSAFGVDDSQFVKIYFQWFSSDAVGFLHMMPLLLTLPRVIDEFKNCKLYMFLLSFLFMAGIGFIQLAGSNVERALNLSNDAGILFNYIICFPLAVWCGSILGTFGFLFSSFLLSLFAVVRIVFIDTSNTVDETISQLTKLQIFIAVLIVSSLSFAVIKEDKDQALRDSQNANAEKASYIAFLCHELRNPLHAIVNLSEFLIDTKLDPDQAKYTEAIRASGEYMGALINDVLDSGKFEAGKVKLELLPVDVSSLLLNMTLPVHQTASARRIEFVTDFRNIPSKLMLDPMRIKQIISNLLSNAIKFTPRSGQITFTVECENRTLGITSGSLMLKLQVSDTGAGIDEVALKSLFKLYQQASVSTSREYGGTGLGLAICKQIVDLMRGTIAVESQLGKGSKFTVRIPVKEPTEGVAIGTYSCIDDYKSDSVRFGYDIVKDDRQKSKAELLCIEILETRLDVQQDNETSALNESDSTAADFSQHVARLPSSNGADDAVPPSDFAENAGSLGSCTPSLTVLCDATMAALNKADQIQRTMEPKHILVVDDSQINRKILCKLLKHPLIKTTECSNGLEVVVMVTSDLESSTVSKYSMIFMDIQMPIMDGNEATRILREKGVAIPIIAVTANSDRYEDYCKSHGFTAKASKPLLKKDVMKILSDYKILSDESN